MAVMVERGWLVGIALAIACGPEVVTPGAEHGDDSSSGPSGETGSPSTTIAESTTVGPDPSTTIATTTTTDTTTSTTEVDSSSDGGESTTDPFECGCPPNVPIGLDDELERGYTPADALAQFDDRTLMFEWLAYGDQPNTTLHLDVEYTGGAIAQGPGGSDGCQFLSFPCDDGVVMDVVLTVSTDDGWVIWTSPAQIHGVVGVELGVSTEYVALGENTGSLAMQQAYDNEMPRTVTTFSLAARRSGFDDETTSAELGGFVSEGGGYYLLLGATPSFG